MNLQEIAFSLYVAIIEEALPVALIFGLCDIAVGTFLRVAFGGRLSFKR